MDRIRPYFVVYRPRYFLGDQRCQEERPIVFYLMVNIYKSYLKLCTLSTETIKN